MDHSEDRVKNQRKSLLETAAWATTTRPKARLI